MSVGRPQSAIGTTADSVRPCMAAFDRDKGVILLRADE